MQEVDCRTVVYRESNGLVEADTECNITQNAYLKTDTVSALIVISPSSYCTTDTCREEPLTCIRSPIPLTKIPVVCCVSMERVTEAVETTINLEVVIC